MKPVKGNPMEVLLCRTNLWHAWELRFSTEGGKWEECSRCRKYRDTRPSGPYMG